MTTSGSDKGFAWEDTQEEEYWGPIIAHMDEETAWAGTKFETAMAELPKATMRWEWFSKMKNESIPELVEIWNELVQMNRDLQRTRC
jgi:hypothetical protein